LAGRCVVDTNSVWDDPLLKGVVWDVLAADAGEYPDFFIRFSATVVDEMAAKYVERARAEADHLADKLQKLLVDSTVIDAAREALDEQGEDITRYLEDRILKGLHGDLLPWPAQTHELIVDRALKRVPPFDDKGGGYRDTLIWLAALDEAERLGTDLIFVSNDSAFRVPGSKQIVLHPDLVAEAAVRGVAASLVATVKQMVTEVLYPPLGTAAGSDPRAYLVSLAAVKSPEDLLTFLEEHLGEPAVTPSLDAETMGLPSSVTDFEINYVENVRDLKLDVVRAIANRQVVCSFTARADVELDVSVYEGSAWAFEWPIQQKYGNGDVRALVHKAAAVSGLVTLSSAGEPVAVEDVEWASELEDGDYSWDLPCGCTSPREHERRRIVISTRSAPRRHE